MLKLKDKQINCYNKNQDGSYLYRERMGLWLRASEGFSFFGGDGYVLFPEQAAVFSDTSFIVIRS